MLATNVHVSLYGDSCTRASVVARSATSAIRGAWATPRETAESRSASRYERVRRCARVASKCLHATRASAPSPLGDNARGDLTPAQSGHNALRDERLRVTDRRDRRTAS